MVCKFKLFYFIKFIAGIVQFKLINNIERVIADTLHKVAVNNTCNKQYLVFIKILIEVEDQSFFKNFGFSIKALTRALLSQFSFFRVKFGIIKNGGSTITMQLARTLFIYSDQNKYIRKFFEIILSVWLYIYFPKKLILQMYLFSVRFDDGVYGIHNAIKHYFGSNKQIILTPAESFFLVERLSNVTSTANKHRIQHLLSRISIKINYDELKYLYEYRFFL